MANLLKTVLVKFLIMFMSTIIRGIQLEAMLPPAEYWIYCTGQFGGVQAFVYNSTECEPIWIKSGALLSTLSGFRPGRFWAQSAQ